MNLFNKLNVILSSGKVSDYKIDCDALTDADLECLAYLISKKYYFSQVIGVPSGGNRLAAALKKYELYNDERVYMKVLLVDDVLTTGHSMERLAAVISEKYIVQGVVIIARGKCPHWVTPILQMWDN